MWFIKKKDNKQIDDTWIHTVKQVTTEHFKFLYVTKFKNYKLNKNESAFLIQIILDLTEEEKVEADIYE